MFIDVKLQLNLAFQLQQSGQFVEAERHYLEILTVEPNNSNVLNLLGILKYQNKQYSEAAVYIKKAIEIKPCAYFYETLGKVQFGAGDFDEAIKSYKKSIELEPEVFDTWFNLASVFKKDKQFQNAIEAYQKALTINPKFTDIYFNLGNIYEELNDSPSAIINYKKALDGNPEDSEASYFLATSYLKVKNFEEGWKYFEKRPGKLLSIFSQMKRYNEIITSKRLWEGESIKDKTLYIYSEAGLGDTIMFARYLPLLKNVCAKVLFKPQVSLQSLFKDSYPDLEIIESKTPDSALKFDVHTPIMSLPYLLHLNSEKIPFDEGFLKANPEKVNEYKQKYFNNDKLKIGIKWQGNTSIDQSRILPLQSFKKLFELPNIKFYSVQKTEIGEVPETSLYDYEIFDLGATFGDFSDTAAALENLDLIICNDTSVAHLAGALGKPCWVLLPSLYNWRWHTDISYSPWYKSLKLFKQNEPGNWDSVFAEIYEKLASFKK